MVAEQAQSDYIIDAMQISLVITVLNEARTIEALCQAIAAQTILPKEMIVVDGGSQDDTVALLQNCSLRWPELHLKVVTKKGNRSIGRNYGISLAKSAWIAITDAGCEPTPTWLAELSAAQQSTHALVVAGYYKGLATSALSQAIIPYVLVMPDQVQPTNFLPATRSMLLSKKVWTELAGFDVRFRHNEDYAFARKLRQHNIRIAFAPRAIVGWQSRETLGQFLLMIYRFAWGDAEAKCWRPKVWLIFTRYLLALMYVIWLVPQEPHVRTTGLLGLLFLITAYCLWAIKKNLRYTFRGWYWLPVLQIVSDWAVMSGTIRGLMSLTNWTLKYW